MVETIVREVEPVVTRPIIRESEPVVTRTVVRESNYVPNVVRGSI